MGWKKKRDVWTEILEVLVKRDWIMKEPGVGWREEYNILLRKAKSQGRQHMQQFGKGRWEQKEQN